MAIIGNDGRLTSDAYLKLITWLLGAIALLASVTLGLGTFFGARALNTLDQVSVTVIRHDVEIINIKEEIRLIRSGGKSRSELLHFRGRGRTDPPDRRDVPRPPHEPPAAPAKPKAPPKPDGPEPQKNEWIL